ncbi:MAG: hypothetical protein ACK53Y_25495 [bacterium]
MCAVRRPRSLCAAKPARSKGRSQPTSWCRSFSSQMTTRQPCTYSMPAKIASNTTSGTALSLTVPLNSWAQLALKAAGLTSADSKLRLRLARTVGNDDRSRPMATSPSTTCVAHAHASFSS